MCKKKFVGKFGSYIWFGRLLFMSPVPEFIDPVLAVKMIVFAKLSPKRSFSFQSVPRDAGLRLFWMRSFSGSFQILELRRGRDQQVLLFKERPY